MTIFKLGNSGGAPGPEQNICFVNAILYLIFSVTAFRNFFKEKIYKGNRNGGQKTPVCDEVSNIFNCVGARTSAGALRQLIGRMSPRFEYIRNGQQQGAPEFLDDLLETLETELKDSGNCQKFNDFRKLFEGCEIIQYNFVGARSRDGECPTCRTPPDYAEKRFNILVLYNDNHRDYSLQQMIDRNLLTPSNVFEKYCANSNCKDSEAKFLRPSQSTRMISDLPNILLSAKQTYKS